MTADPHNHFCMKIRGLLSNGNVMSTSRLNDSPSLHSSWQGFRNDAS